MPLLWLKTELTKWVTEVTIYPKITKEKELLKERRKNDI